jgi:hypothetical protein
MLAPAVAVVIAGPAASPPDAVASGLTITNGACFAAGQPVALSGTGFTAGAPVTLGGATSATVTADLAGVFATSFAAPRASSGPRPRAVAVTASDGANPLNAAPPARFGVVRAGLDGNYARALNGPPAQRTTWRFAGFTPGRAVYAHLRSGSRLRGTHRFGVARGDCGTLVVRARRVPFDGVVPGRWRLQIDQRRRWSPRTAPRRVITVAVRRR